MKQLSYVVLLVTLASASACGGSPTTPSNEDISGTWSGFASARATNYTVSTAQNGTTLSGTWSDNFTHGGTVTGTKTDANVSVTLVGNSGSCSLSFTGTLTSLTNLSGTIAGINCVNNQGGALTLLKQ